jgi:regulator of replication initiation timing
MKQKITFILFFVVFFTLGQTSKNKTIDTNQICMPYSVVQKILLDLNNYDKLKETIPTYQNEIYQLNKKTELLVKENEAVKKEDDLNRQIISEMNESIKIYKSENEDLKKENKRIKIKNGLFNIISGIIIVPLTYFAVFK